MIGKILNGRYEIIEKIGEGGMAFVYRAKCHLLNREVAVKILKSEFTNDESIVGKFKGEAAAAAGLCGNNIVNIYDVGSEGDMNYIVMELVMGKTLKEIINEEKILNEEKVIDIAIQICKALQSAHRKRVIHRDIKPHNIIVDGNGVVKVADFGIAKAVDQSTITHTTKVMGTAHYFSPEQAKGGYVDFRSDIYSLGIVIYEMITGKVPYDSDSIVSVALKHIQEELVQPKILNKKISKGLNDIILKCLKKEPNKRYQTSQELLSDLMLVKDKKKIVVEKEDESLQHTKVMDAAQVQSEIENSKVKNKDGKKTKKKVLYIAIFLLCILGASVGTTWAIYNMKYKEDTEVVEVKQTIVPFIIGEKIEDKKDTIEMNRLSYSILREAKSDAPKGTIIECSPVGGTKVDEGTILKLVISRGPEGVKVNDYRGMNIDTVKGMLASDGLKLGTIQYKFSIIEKGSIISQSPEVGSEVEKNSKLSFVISKGPEISLVIVPNVIGMELEDGKKILENSGLTIGEVNAVETNDPEDKGIFSQSISSGTEVKEKSTINLSYYEYKEDQAYKITMMNFIGMLGIDAEQKAYNTGIEVQIEGELYDEVVHQSIEAGTEVDAGVTVKLTTKKDEKEQ